MANSHLRFGAQRFAQKVSTYPVVALRIIFYPQNKCWDCLTTNNITRSSKKGPYVDPRVLKKIEGKKPGSTGVIKTWSRACQIAPEMVGFTFGVHNGRDHVEVFVTEDMVGHRLGEFSPTRKFTRHGGKMQKELEMKQKETEIAAARAAKAAVETK